MQNLNYSKLVRIFHLVPLWGITLQQQTSHLSLQFLELVWHFSKFHRLHQLLPSLCQISKPQHAVSPATMDIHESKCFVNIQLPLGYISEPLEAGGYTDFAAAVFFSLRWRSASIILASGAHHVGIHPSSRQPLQYRAGNKHNHMDLLWLKSSGGFRRQCFDTDYIQTWPGSCNKKLWCTVLQFHDSNLQTPEQVCVPHRHLSRMRHSLQVPTSDQQSCPRSEIPGLYFQNTLPISHFMSKQKEKLLSTYTQGLDH
ncbi:hypothetical protein FB451DRAFT_1196691 [Mycena latifolia]|nr:hypothetical protein FB451DRAFT_1196691 [Mycena latifolia]